MSFIPIHYKKGDKAWTWIGTEDGYKIIQVTITNRCDHDREAYDYIQPDGEYSVKSVAYLFPHKKQAVIALRKYLLDLADGCRFNIQQNASRLERGYTELKYNLEELRKLENIDTTEEAT